MGSRYTAATGDQVWSTSHWLVLYGVVSGQGSGAPTISYYRLRALRKRALPVDALGGLTAWRAPLVTRLRDGRRRTPSRTANRVSAETYSNC